MSGRSGGMADAPDSKSGPRKWVWVQVPPSALYRTRTYGKSPKTDFIGANHFSQNFTRIAPKRPDRHFALFLRWAIRPCRSAADAAAFHTISQGRGQQKRQARSLPCRFAALPIPPLIGVPSRAEQRVRQRAANPCRPWLPPACVQEPIPASPCV
jgi:hypothetical protein